MLFHSKKDKEICSETGGLKLGRMYASIFIATTQSQQQLLVTIEKLKLIPGLEIINADPMRTIFSIRLHKSIIKDEKQIQDVVDSIIQNLKTDEEKNSASHIVTTIKKLTGVNVEDSDRIMPDLAIKIS